MMTYEEKLNQAAKNWFAMNPHYPNYGRFFEALKLKIGSNNNQRQSVPCDTFDYSGTIWCDGCGWERKDH